MEELLDLALIGVASVVAVLILMGIAITIIHVFAQRSQQHISELSHNNLLSTTSLAMNGILGLNGLQIVDEATEGHGQRKVQVRRIESQGSTSSPGSGS